jgi:PPOX class probable F420-dependent enzyme
MDDGALAEFLDRKARLGSLVTLRRDGSPTAIPVWFGWDGAHVTVFSDASSTKLARITNDPRVSLLVSNDVGEPEAWVAFDGEAEISEEGGFELAEKLAPLYWDLDDPEAAGTLDEWRAAASHFRLITFSPTTIRSSP